MSLLLAIYLHVRKTNLKHINNFRQSIQLPCTFPPCSTKQPNNEIDNSIHSSATSSSIRTFAKSFTCKRINTSPKLRPRKMTKSEQKRISSIRKIRNQSILHALMLLVVYFPPFLAFILSSINPNKSTPTWLLAFLSILTPSQGILILIVFTSPNILVIRERFPETRRIKALWQVIKAGNKIPLQYCIRPSRSTRRRGNRSDYSSASVCSSSYKSHTMRRSSDPSSVSVYSSTYEAHTMRRNSLGEDSFPIQNLHIMEEIVCPNNDSLLRASTKDEKRTCLHGLELESGDPILYEKNEGSMRYQEDDALVSISLGNGCDDQEMDIESFEQSLDDV